MRLTIRPIVRSRLWQKRRRLHQPIARRYDVEGRRRYGVSLVHREHRRPVQSTQVIRQAMNTVVQWISKEKKKKQEERPLIVIDRFGRFSFKETLSSATVTKFYRQIVERHFLRKERQPKQVQPVLWRQMTQQLFDRIQQTSTLRHYSTNWLQSLQRVVWQSQPKEERPLTTLRQLFIHELQKRTEQEPQREQRRWQQQFVRMLRLTQRNPRRQSSVATLQLLQQVMRQPSSSLKSLTLKERNSVPNWRPVAPVSRERVNEEGDPRWLIHVTKWLKRQEREERQEEKPLVLRQLPMMSRQPASRQGEGAMGQQVLRDEGKSAFSLDQLVSRVYAEIERKMRLQRERRGR